MICPEGNVSAIRGKKQEIMKSQWIEYDGGMVGRGKASGGLARGTVGAQGSQKIQTRS